MQKLGLEPSSCTYNSLAKAIISVGRIGDAIELVSGLFRYLPGLLFACNFIDMERLIFCRLIFFSAKRDGK